ncbi:MAG: hypothetical protein WCS59_03440 [Sphaerochaetaceae bacterium]|jgi:hypothetical protein|nr:hypothetical protein [Sphaerochaetaceae bacterium]MDD4218558.1 hypothetical protein [Sphaerochaetaceae bacterium]MDY0371400.1 hypothetical protein [Sphaerochaetaceae bacterium]
MQNNYQIFHRKQDIGKRISLLHREETLSIGMLAVESGEILAQSIASLEDYEPWALHVLMYEDQGRIPELRKRFPDVTFIVFRQPVSFGTLANALANECYTTFFYLTRSDLRQVVFSGETAIELLHRSDKPAAVTPIVTNRLGELIPVIQAPMLKNDIIDPISFIPQQSITATLYPFLGIGIYERALFQRLRGFDELIEGDYWQVLDFGLRAWLYGYPIFNIDAIQCTFVDRQFIIEDRSQREGIKRVHTKALGVRQINGKNYPKRVRRFNDSHLHAEVKKRLALYKTDFQQLVEQWEIAEKAQ